mgnify:CR=1 FL=1|jgi:His/Glu/Gln/Arg/opine family amino acid ABC transporter permease subunit
MSLLTLAAQLLAGMGRSALLFALTLLLALPLGLLTALLRRCRFALPRLLAAAYISVLRGTPLMLQLMVVYFGPYYLFGTRISVAYQFWAAVIAFVLNYAAYFGEILRGAIAAVPRSQWEAARSLGCNARQAFLRVVLPQAVPRALPAVTNEAVTLVKDTSLAFVIAYAEMFTLAKRIAARESSVLPLMAAGVFYYVFNLLVALAAARIEKRCAFD